MSYKKLIRRWDSEREVFYDDIFNHFYAVRPGRYRTRWNNANEGPLRRSRSFKVTDFCTNRKFMYNFLIVINNNLPPIFHHLRDMVFDRSKIVILGYLATALTFNPPTTEGFPIPYRRKWYIAKMYTFWATFVSHKIWANIQPLLRSAPRKLPNSVT